MVANTRAADSVSATLVYWNPPRFRCVTVNDMFGYRRLNHEVASPSVACLTLVTTDGQATRTSDVSDGRARKIISRRVASESSVQEGRRGARGAIAVAAATFAVAALRFDVAAAAEADVDVGERRLLDVEVELAGVAARRRRRVVAAANLRVDELPRDRRGRLHRTVRIRDDHARRRVDGDDVERA